MSQTAMYKSFDAAPSSALAPSAPSASYAPPFQPGSSAVMAGSDQKTPLSVSEEGVPTQYQETLKEIRSATYVEAFDAKGVTGDDLVAGLTRVFNENQIPKGLKSKLTPLKGTMLHFKIDDSSSMLNASNLPMKDLSDYVPKNPAKGATDYATRWEEAEDRLHRLIDVLAYVPTGPITLSYFDRDQPGQRVILERKNQTPEEFLKEAHKTVRQLFNKKPDGATPIYQNLLNMINEADRARGKSEKVTMHYIIGDGEPYSPPIKASDEIRMIKTLLENVSRNAKLNPVTFLGCSNIRADYKWMHEMEEVAENVAALCDFTDEQLEIYNAQGAGFNYSKGMWLICNLVAAINPTDLDLLDLRVPITKMTMDNLFAKVHTELEYSGYFNNHPNARVFAPDYQLFLRTPNATSIPSVALFRSVLKRNLDKDIDEGQDDTEEAELQMAAQAVMDSRQRGYGGKMFGGSNAEPLLPQPQPQADSSSCCTIS